MLTLKALVRNTLLWCEGRLEELRRRGFLKNQEPPLTAKGWQAYLDLKSSGFQPQREKVFWTLLANRSIPPDQIEQFAGLLMMGD